MLSAQVFQVPEVHHSISVSFSLQHQWDFTLRAGFLWALLWSFVSFALLCAVIRSQVNQIDVVLTRVSGENELETNRREADSKHSLVGFIP